MTSTEFLKCKLCKKMFLIIKEPHKPTEHLCWVCIGLPELEPYRKRQNV